MSRPNEELTATSYAILGLLAVQPWSTYELAKQMERTLNNFWPRARSKLYEEPKKLAARGLAKASKEPVGKRPRTVYSITAKGRRALSGWLAVPGRPPVLESEQLTKLFFADHGTKADALATIDAAREWAAREVIAFADVAQTYLSGGGPFRDRVGTNMIGGRFMIDFYMLVYTWSLWASDAVAGWPDEPSAAPPDWSVMEHIAHRGDEVRASERARSRSRRGRTA